MPENAEKLPAGKRRMRPLRIVVFSDSHNHYAALEKALLDQPDADLFLYLGDGTREFEDLRQRHPEIAMRGVAGNCDIVSDF